MFRSHIKLYLILLGILGVLIIVVTILTSPKKQVVNNHLSSNVPTPTSVAIIPTSSTKKIVITPRFTGANEDIPTPVLNLAMQKQALKKSTPITQDEFTIIYDYQSDIFVVTLSEPKQNNKTVFEQWLKQNYPLLSLNKFLLK